jgi:hypothetical protein
MNKEIADEMAQNAHDDAQADAAYNNWQFGGTPPPPTDSQPGAHTPEPWHMTFGSYVVNGGWMILPEGQENWQQHSIAEVSGGVNQPANARRIVACVNACKDWPTDMLEAWAADPTSPLLTNNLRQQDARMAVLEAEKAVLQRDAEALWLALDESYVGFTLQHGGLVNRLQGKYQRTALREAGAE